MHVEVIPDIVVVPRIVTNIDYKFGTVYYGHDNLYPQNLEEISKKSPTVKACIQILTDFTDGEGWTNNGDQEVNRWGHTWNDILHYAAMNYSLFDGFALHLNFDGGGNIIEVQSVPFEYVRFGLPNNDGVITDCYVSNNWEKNSRKYPDKPDEDPVRYPLYNPYTAAFETIAGGNGQILYWTPEQFTYPLATFDAVREAALTDAEIQTFMHRQIVNGFLGTTVFKYPGGFENEEERRKVTSKVGMLKGSYNANGIILAETPEDFTGTLIENIPANNQDRLFEQTEKSTRDKIIQNYGMPPPLVGVQPEGGVFTQAAMRDSYIYFNTRTKNRRNILKRIFNKLDPSLGDIIPNNFEYADGALATNDNQFSQEEERSQENGGTTDNTTE